MKETNHVIVGDYVVCNKQDLYLKSVHEGKKPFKCDICNITFTRRSDLKIYNKSIHEKK